MTWIYFGLLYLLMMPISVIMTIILDYAEYSEIKFKNKIASPIWLSFLSFIHVLLKDFIMKTILVILWPLSFYIFTEIMFRKLQNNLEIAYKISANMPLSESEKDTVIFKKYLSSSKKDSDELKSGRLSIVELK